MLELRPEMASFPKLQRSLQWSALLTCLTLSAGCSRKTAPATTEKSESDSAVEPIAAAAQPSTPEKAQAPDVSAAASPTSTASARELSGDEILEKIRSSGAKFTLLNAWASWCGPCRVEFPMLVALSDNMKARGVKVMFVSMDEPESVPIAVEFAENNGLALPIFVAKGPFVEFKQALHARWPGMLPATFLFDSNGNLKHFWGGPVYEHELLPILERVLNGQEVEIETRLGVSPGNDLRDE